MSNEGLPLILCDHCNLPILNKEVIIKYKPIELTLVVHKGSCDMRSDGGIGVDRWPWMTFDSLLKRLKDRYR